MDNGRMTSGAYRQHSKPEPECPVRAQLDRASRCLMEIGRAQAERATLERVPHVIVSGYAMHVAEVPDAMRRRATSSGGLSAKGPQDAEGTRSVIVSGVTFP
jgi:hypothetical protein